MEQWRKHCHHLEFISRYLYGNGNFCGLLYHCIQNGKQQFCHYGYYLRECY